MPLVARSIQILNGLSAVSLPMIFMTALTWCSTSCLGQNSADPPAPQPDESAATSAAGKGCAQRIEEQQALVRSLRILQKPVEYPSKAEADRLRRNVSSLIKNGFKGVSDTKSVETYLEYLILRATDPEFIATPANMQDLMEDVISTVEQSGGSIGNPQERLAARRLHCATVLKITKQLLDNNFDARMAAVIIVSRLQDSKAVSGGAKAKVHDPAITTLISILADQQQPDAIKATVAGQLGYLLRTCDILPQDEFRMCDAIANELKKPCTEAGYQLILLDAALEITQPRKKIGAPEPTAMKIFAATLNDPNKPVEVRCRAAFGVGHGAYDPTMRLESLAWKIAQLSGETAIEFNKDPGHPKWKACGQDLFYAFWHMNPSQREGANMKGLLNRDAKSKMVADAGPLVGSVALNLMLNSAKFKAAELQPLADFLKTKPANGNWDQNGAPIQIN